MFGRNTQMSFTLHFLLNLHHTEVTAIGFPSSIILQYWSPPIYPHLHVQTLDWKGAEVHLIQKKAYSLIQNASLWANFVQFSSMFASFVVNYCQACLSLYHVSFIKMPLKVHSCCSSKPNVTNLSLHIDYTILNLYRV